MEWSELKKRLDPQIKAADMGKAKRILQQQMQKKKIRFLEWADVLKSRKANDEMCARLKKISELFGSGYHDSNLTGKAALKHIFEKIMRRQGYLRAIKHMNEIA